jgi:hypothetical protein
MLRAALTPESHLLAKSPENPISQTQMTILSGEASAFQRQTNGGPKGISKVSQATYPLT